MSIKENTIMELMYKEGVYKLPNPWGFVKAIDKILQDDEIKNSIYFSWFGEKDEELYLVKEKRCYSCLECEEKIVDFCKKISEEYNKKEELIKLLEWAKHSKCGCYNKFMNKVLIENDGKVPLERYYEFLKRVCKVC